MSGVKFGCKVYFEPWIGENFTKTDNFIPRLLVLGESHYFNEDFDEDNSGETESQNETSQFTSHIVKTYLNYLMGKESFIPWMRTFTRFANIFLGKPSSKEQKIEFWKSIVFYNYVQFPITEPRIPPTKEEFELSADSFFEVLKIIKPQLVLVWGVRLWDNMPNSGEWGPEVLDGENGKLYYYPIEKINIPAYGIYHPASSALTYKHHKYIQEAIRISQKS